MSDQSLKIAICGGGIASLCLAHALARYPQLDVTIFEQSPVLREAGASVGLGPNAHKAMALISSELRHAIDKAGGVPCHPMLRIMLAVEGQHGRHVYDLDPPDTQIIVYWGALYKTLYDLVPENTMQLGKGAAGAEQLDNGRVRINFEDGTSYEADGVIGCDGINSSIRRAILGSDHVAAEAVNTDRLGFRIVVPMDEAITAFGKDYCSTPTQCGWIGDNSLLITDHANNGESMQLIANFPLAKSWPHKSSFGEWPKEDLQERMSRCGDFGKAMAKLFCDQPKLYAARGRKHPDTPTFCKSHLCIAGDAAQSFVPFYGAGAGQAIEDALILSSVLSQCSTPNDIRKAFEIYDDIRRPRRTTVAHMSDWAAIFLTGRDPEAGLDPDRLASRLSTWGTDIYEYDLAAAKEEAVQRMGTKHTG